MARTLCLLVLLFPVFAYPDVYRWVDEDGIVHFGDRSPAQREAQTVRVEPSPHASPERLKNLERERKALISAAEKRQRAAARERQRAARARARERRKLEEWRAQCGETRERVAEIESELRSGYSAAQGEILHRKLARLREREASQCR